MKSDQAMLNRLSMLEVLEDGSFNRLALKLIPKVLECCMPEAMLKNIKVIFRFAFLSKFLIFLILLSDVPDVGCYDELAVASSDNKDIQIVTINKNNSGGYGYDETAQVAARRGSSSSSSAIKSKSSTTFSSREKVQIYPDFNDSVDWNDISVGPLLGSGSFGMVFEGEWCGSQVAVKRLAMGDSKSASALERELKLMRKLPPHPHVLRVLVSNFLFSKKTKKKKNRPMRNF